MNSFLAAFLSHSFSSFSRLFVYHLLPGIRGRKRNGSSLSHPHASLLVVWIGETKREERGKRWERWLVESLFPVYHLLLLALPISLLSLTLPFPVLSFPSPSLIHWTRQPGAENGKEGRKKERRTGESRSVTNSRLSSPYLWLTVSPSRGGMNEMNGKERSETRRGETGHLFLLSVAIDDPEGREGEKKGRFPFALQWLKERLPRERGRVFLPVSSLFLVNNLPNEWIQRKRWDERVIKGENRRGKEIKIIDCKSLSISLLSLYLFLCLFPFFPFHLFLSSLFFSFHLPSPSFTVYSLHRIPSSHYLFLFLEFFFHDPNGRRSESMVRLFVFPLFVSFIAFMFVFLYF